MVRLINGKNISFKYFFNAGYDRVTNECDLEGSDVFDGEEQDSQHWIGMIKWVVPSEISEMEDEELEELLFENNVLI